MEFYFNSQPFDHIIIKNLYDTEEYKSIVDEIEWLTKSNILIEGNNIKKSGSAFVESYEIEKEKKISLSNKKCIFLNDIYSIPELSKILKIGTKLLEKTYSFLYHTDVLKNNNSFIFEKYFKNTIKYNTLLNFYQDGGEYKSHRDRAVFTCIWFHWKNKKLFEGGDLFFEEYNYLYECENNSAIIFPSPLLHEVISVKAREKFDSLDGRYSITNFLLIPENN